MPLHATAQGGIGAGVTRGRGRDSEGGQGGGQERPSNQQCTMLLHWILNLTITLTLTLTLNLDLDS